MPRPLRLVLFVLSLVAVVLGILTPATNLIPTRTHAWIALMLSIVIALMLSIVIALREAIPALWARFVTAPDVEQARVSGAIMKVGAVVGVLSLTGCEHPIGDAGEIACAGALYFAGFVCVVMIYLCGRRAGAFVLLMVAMSSAHALPVPGVVLAPGPDEVAAEAARTQQALPQPITYAADLAPLQVSPALLAQPSVAQQVVPPQAPPAVALDPRLPLCPPAPVSAVPTTADKIQRWIAIGAAALAGTAYLVEKIDAAGRASMTP